MAPSRQLDKQGPAMLPQGLSSTTEGESTPASLSCCLAAATCIAIAILCALALLHRQFVLAIMLSVLVLFCAVGILRQRGLIPSCGACCQRRRPSSPKIVLPWEELPTAAKCAPRYWGRQDLLEGTPTNKVAMRPEGLVAIQALLDGSPKEPPSPLGSPLPRMGRGKAAAAQLRVTDCQRIENARLWKMYAVARYALTRKWQRRAVRRLPFAEDLNLPKNAALCSAINEVYLWYSCDPAEAAGIVEEGFSIVKLRKKGLRFTISSKEAWDDQAVGADVGQLRCLLLCRVVLGEVYQCKQDEEEVGRHLASGKFDSVLLGKSHVYVPSQAMAYPEYLVFVKREAPVWPPHSAFFGALDGLP